MLRIWEQACELCSWRRCMRSKRSAFCHRTVTGICQQWRKRNFADLGETRGMYEKQSLESFVARIWLERGPGGDVVWRGHVRHVQGEEETYFQDLGAMSKFLERVSGVSGPLRTGGPTKGAKDSNPGPEVMGKDN